jgi:hypothetical protein
VSCPHTHQQNGSTERKHHHIVETGLALLAHSSVPLHFLGDAFLTACLLINSLPSRVIDSKTPLEMLTGSKPDFSMIKVFGAACWPNLRPYNAHKLSFRSKQCVFIGYSEFHKGYKCLHIPTRRVYISRDVNFYENVFPFCKNSASISADTPIDASALLLPSLAPSMSGQYNNDTIAISVGTNPSSGPTDDSMLVPTGEQ